MTVERGGRVVGHYIEVNGRVAYWVGDVAGPPTWAWSVEDARAAILGEDACAAKRGKVGAGGE